MEKIKIIVLVFGVIIAIFLSFFLGQAWSKRNAQVASQGTADIAHWSFKVNDNDEKVQKLSLKSTSDNEKIVENKIAPGSKGDFQIKLDASKSDVSINYFIKFENETQKPTNLKFEYEGNQCSTLDELQKLLNGTLSAKSEEKILKISWLWDYETGSTDEEIRANDKIDTEDSKKISDYKFDIIVSGTQVNLQ